VPGRQWENPVAPRAADVFVRLRRGTSTSDMATRWTWLAVVLATFVAAGCSARPTSDVLQPFVPAPSYTSKVEILVATTRDRGTPTDPDAFTARRAGAVNHASVTVSIPKNHVPGRIEWPDQLPADPLNHFVTTDRSVLSAPQFLDRVRQRARAPGAEAGSLLVYVHGYNTLYEEAVYRFAQIVHDSGYNGTAVLFSWPSRGKAPLYLADRDASTWSRDYLEQTLRRLAGLREVREINVLAHSMGSWLVAEVLRQAKLKGDGQFGGKLNDVILASPDIDVGVFVSQLETIGRLRRPMTILASGDDNVLALSTLLSGGVQRVGLVTANDARVVERAQEFNLRVIDLTKVAKSPSGLAHNKFADSAAVLVALGRALAADDRERRQQGGGLVAAVSDVGTSLIRVPAAIIGAPLPQ
jgi:esterase/lipase superfamily enzyme